jgi:uncharacterized Fe-S center protein
MEKSKVYFTDMRTNYENSMLKKFNDLLVKSGMLEMDFKDKFVALKIHFGEHGNLAFIKPNYVKVIVDLIKSKGGIPFLTDASTLYSGSRSDAVHHLITAELNGFNTVTTGCPIVIADGLKGDDYNNVEVNLKHCKTVKIGTAIMDADIVISLSHFKGHEMTGFGGTIKNIGMGCGSKLGKLEMHSGGKPNIDQDKCVACGSCAKACNQKAISILEKANIDYNKCVGCGECIVACKINAISHDESNSKILNEKIVEYTYGVIKDKPHYHVNFIMNISPECDCWGMNDSPIAPDIGIMASFDPVAIDIASADMVNEAPHIHTSMLGDKKYKEKTDKFKCMHDNTDWVSGIDYAVELGLGSKSYEIIKEEL